ncbi:hypothetical protein BDN72DRAFT_494152 [Pluteus cervinus]|uniref:Uncharacterized protein n=1 Tax=Pluteus cervinus TaxID=181527 RepID=A0ACD3A596_9AGAR|nr:hypothetical protein BDN72DRAFT_494152 [Pluteus cervinus]
MNIRTNQSCLTCHTIARECPPHHQTTFRLTIASELCPSRRVWDIGCMQAHTYFTRKSSDKLVFKAIIALLCLLDMFDTLRIGSFVYFDLVSQYGNPLALSVEPWSLDVQYFRKQPISDFIIRM